MATTYEPIIGLEIHVQLKTASKMFCSCDNTGEDQPINTTICRFDDVTVTGQGGATPGGGSSPVFLKIETPVEPSIE